MKLKGRKCWGKGRRILWQDTELLVCCTGCKTLSSFFYDSNLIMPCMRSRINDSCWFDSVAVYESGCHCDHQSYNRQKIIPRGLLTINDICHVPQIWKDGIVQLHREKSFVCLFKKKKEKEKKSYWWMHWEYGKSIYLLP